MDVWNQYVGKKIFLRTKYDRVYSGTVSQVNGPFLSIIDSKNRSITIATADIVEIKEEA